MAWLVSVALAASTARAQADTGAFFEGGALPVQGYDLRLSAGLDYATRQDFAWPVALFHQPLERMRAFQASAQLDVRLSLTPNLALQAVVPLVYRDLQVRLDGVLLSETTQVSDRELRLTGLGFADSTLALSYRVPLPADLAAFVDLGVSIPIDDNPGASTLPERVPPGDGQGELFAGLGGTAQWDALGLALAYRFALLPQATATYLITDTARQAHASGALGVRTRHVVTGRGDYRALSWLSLSLCPQLSVLEAPTVVSQGRTFAIISAPLLVQLTLRAGARLHLSETHALELYYRQPLLTPWDVDPLFPLAMPPQGGGLTWLVFSK